MKVDFGWRLGMGVMVLAAALPAFALSEAEAERRAGELLARMTLKEKLGQLNQLVVFKGADYAAKDDAENLRLVREGAVSSFIWGDGDPQRRNALQRAAVEESRMGIPLLFAQDMIHGTHLTFPISPALAGAFEPELFERAQAVAARECRAEGIEWAFAPMCDIARDPRWGRVQETCGEDPYLTALCCAAQVRGFQGSDVAATNRVVACPKHFVGYSAVTGGRDYNDADCSPWTLRNLHLPAFRSAIAEAGAWTVMSSFNTVDGIPAVTSGQMLTDVLRGEWGFRGFVVSDWGAVNEVVNWGCAADLAEAAEQAMLAGNDMDMKSDGYVKHLEAAVKAGRVPEAAIDTAVLRVLKVKLLVGLFEHPYVDEGLKAAVWAASRQENAALARECVAKSAVLLKNAAGVLPLKAERLGRVALIGPFADNAAEMLGAWAGRGEEGTVVTLRAALAQALPQAQIETVKGCEVSAEPLAKVLQDGSRVDDPEASRSGAALEVDAAVKAAQAADAVILALGEPRWWTGENASRHQLTLTGRQQELFDAVVATGKPVITLVFAGRPLALEAVWERSAAVLYCWQPGSEAGNGLVDLLLGKVSPSARLTMSVPRSSSSVPCYYNHPVTGRPGMGQYRDQAVNGARYPFGYGLTYSEFEYSPLTVTGSVARCTVRNVGKVTATETVQLYVRQVTCRAGWRPQRELRGFRRLTLKSGEAAEVSFTLDAKTLGYFDRSGRPVCDRGEYRLWIVPDSAAGEAEGTAYRY